MTKLSVAGEMGRLVLRHNWAATPLGPIEDWSVTLRLGAAMCLISQQPMLLWWGPERVAIYNDGYRPLLGIKHPDALGARGATIWPEIWDDLGPMLDGVFAGAGNGATWYADQQLFLERHGYTEETYFTYSTSPMFYGSGAIAGVVSATLETTATVLNARRMATIAELAARLVVAESPSQVIAEAVEILARNPADIAGVRICPVSVEAAESFPSTAGGVIELVLTADTVLAVAEGATGQRLDNGTGTGSVYAVPVREPGSTAAYSVLAVALSVHLPFDDNYRTFLDAVADHVATAVRAAGRIESERLRAAALAEMDAAKTVFFSEISHELRTPLTLIGAPVSDLLAERRGPINAGQREFLEMAQRNAGRLTELVRGMLDFARIEAGRLAPDAIAVDLPGVTSGLAASFAPAIAAAGLSFERHVERLPRPVYVDPDMWDRIVLNLLSNALKYTLTGSIRLDLKDTGGQIELAVSDTGIGVSAADQARLFERFYRARNSGGRSVEGSGIGLALVAELARLHGGEASVTSTVGSGSRFVVRLPYGEAAGPRKAGTVTDPARAAEPYLREAQNWSVAGPQAPAAPRPDLPQLLVAEDGADMREYLGQLLAGDFEVTFAVDGAQALTMARTGAPDLVLADVQMASLDGFELLAALRADATLRGVPVVMLSARGGDEASTQAFKAGADDFVSKPFTGTDLIARLRASLDRARARENEAAWRPVALNFLSDGVAIGDATGQVVEVNEAWERLTGYGAADAPYSPPYPWFPSAEEDPVGRALCDEAMLCWLEEKASVFDVPMRHRDGHTVWVRSIAVTSRSPVDGSTLLAAFIKAIPAPDGAPEADALP